MNHIHEIEADRQTKSKGGDIMARKTGKRVVALMLSAMMMMQSAVTAGAAVPEAFAGNFDDEFLSTNNDTNLDEPDTLNQGGDTYEEIEQQNNFEGESGEGPQEGSGEGPQEEPQEEAAVITSAAAQDVQVRQKEDGTKDTYIRYEISVKNESQEAAAENVNVKMILPETLTYVYDETETEGLSTFDNAASLTEGFDLSEVDEATLAAYGSGQVLMWAGQSLAAGEQKNFVCYAQAQIDVTDAAALTAAIYANAQYVEASWTNQELLAENVTPQAPEAETPVETPEEEEPAETPKEEEPKETPAEEEPVETPAEEKKDAAEENEFDKLLNNKKANKAMQPFGLLGGDEEANPKSGMEKTSSDLDDYKPSLKFDFGTDTVKANSWVNFTLNFEEDDSDDGFQFPVYYDGATENSNGAITYNILDNVTIRPNGTDDGSAFINPLIITDTQKGTLYRQTENGLDMNEIWGDYTIAPDGTLTIKFNEKVRDKYKDCKASLTFNARFSLQQIPGKETVEFIFDGNLVKVFDIEPGLSVSARKGASEYRPADNGFLFTIEVLADTDVNDLVITDKMGRGLDYKDGSLVIKDEHRNIISIEALARTVAKDGNGFILTLPNLPAGTYFIEYIAETNREVMLESNGAIPSDALTNAATFKIGEEEGFTIDGNARYSHKWVEKTSSYDVDSKTASWTITVNPGAEQNASGLTVTDELKSDKLSYDEARGITITKSYLNDNGELVSEEPFTVPFADYISDSHTSWSYLIGEETTNYQYTFTYHTRVSEPDNSSEMYYNSAQVGKHSVTGDITVSKGDFNNTQSVKKSFVEQVTVDKVGYAKWTSELTIPAGAYTQDLVLTDTLYGSQVLPDSMELAADAEKKVPGKVYFRSDKNSIALDKCTLERIDDTSFKVTFKQPLTVAEKTKVTLTYFTKITGAGVISNANDFLVNGKVQSSVDYGNAEDANLKKSGVYNPSSGRIVWTIELGEGFNNYVTIEDSFPNQTYYDGSFKAYKNGRPIATPRPTVAEDKASFSAYINLPYEEGAEYSIVYETTPNRGIAGSTYGNTVVIKNDDGSELGGTTATIKLPSDVFDKSIFVEPDKANGYVATFALMVNEGGMQWPEGALSPYTYTIEDTLGSNLKYKDGSLKVYEGKDETGTLLEAGVNKGYTVNYNNHVLTIIINSTREENGTGKTYFLTYEAEVSSPNPTVTEPVEYTNTAVGTICGQREIDTVKDEVTIEAKTEGGVTGTRRYFRIFKQTTGGEVLPGAKFKIFRVNADGTETELQEKEVPEDGFLYFGQNPIEEGPNSNLLPGDFVVRAGDKYVLRETFTPEGYKPCAPVYVSIGADAEGYRNCALNDSINIVNQRIITKKVEKIWNDNNLTGEGIIANRPAIQVNLYRQAGNGTKELVQTVSLTSANEWKYQWDDLLETDENGNIYDYTVEELDSSALLPYEVGKVQDDSKSADKNTFTITNKLRLVQVKASKQWDDSNNQDGKRAEKMGDVYLQLYQQIGADGQETISSYGGDAKQLDIKGNKDYSWNNLPKYLNGEEVIYTVKEGKMVNNAFKPFEDFTEAELAELEYISTRTEDAQKGFVFKNSYKTKKTRIEIEKTWYNGATQLTDVKATEIHVQLYKSLDNGRNWVKEENQKTLSKADGWKKVLWTELPVYQNGKKILYSVKEVGAVEDFELATGTDYVRVIQTDESKYTVTLRNNYKPATIPWNVRKVWEDDSNADDTRAASIDVVLEWCVEGATNWTTVTGIDGIVAAQTLSGTANQWEYAWPNKLPKKNAQGQNLQYRVRETSAIDGYSVAYDDNQRTRISTITNSITTEKTKVVVKKEWSDTVNGTENLYNNRPASIQVTLMQGEEGKGTKVTNLPNGQANPITLNEAGGWEGGWSGLPKNAGGKSINYYVEETITSDYELADPIGKTDITENGNVAGTKFILTNKLKEADTSVAVIKKWSDSDNAAGKRPAAIQVQLYQKIGSAAGTAYGNPVTLNEANSWKTIWTGLPTRINRQNVTYYVAEILSADLTEFYTPSNNGRGEAMAATEDGYNNAADHNYKITNTYKDFKVRIDVTKKWNDSNNQDGIRPRTITFDLYADGQKVDGASKTINVSVTGETSAASWTGLDKFVDGKRVVYTVEEVMPAGTTGYTSAITREQWSEDYSSYSVTFTNTHETEKTSVEAQKIWDDAIRPENARPASITLQLWSTMTTEAEGKNLNKDVVLDGTETTPWHAVWSNLPKYENGEIIKYFVKEQITSALQNGKYTVEVTPAEGADDNGYILSEKIWSFVVTNTREDDKVSIQAKKKWADNNNSDGLRPLEIEVTLYQSVDGADPVAVAGKAPIWITGGATAAEWAPNTAKWENLPKYTADQKSITYSVKETAYKTADGDLESLTGATTLIQGYEEPEYAISGSVITITNKRNYEEKQIRVRKHWDDEDNYDGYRVGAISVQLYRSYTLNGQKVKEAVGAPVALNESKNWIHEWSKLPANIYADGKSQELTYSVEEETALVGYDTPTYETETIDGFDIAFVVKNTHELEKIKVQFRKNWNDNGNQDVKRPENLLMKLYRYTGSDATQAEAVDPYEDAAGKTVATEVTLTGDKTAVLWEHTWSNLPKRAQGGELYTYTVKEGIKDEEGNFLPYDNDKNKLEHYTVGEAGTTVVDADKITDTLKAGDQSVQITNTHETDRMLVELIKYWNEDNSEDRPAEVTFTLMADKYLGEGNGWSGPTEVKDSEGNVLSVTLEVRNSKLTHQWKDLEVNSHGKPIEYSIKEEGAGTYALTQEYGNGLIEAWNTKVERKRIDVSKEWNDFNNAAGKRPGEITVVLWADKKVEDIQTVKADANGKWSCSWENLPVYTKDANGNPVEIDYSVTEGLEAMLKGYDQPVVTDETPENSQNETWKIVNRYHETVEKTAIKNWADNSDQDGIRPEIYVGLYESKNTPVLDVNNEPYVQKVTGKDNQWTYTWTNLPKYDAATGTEIQYFVQELKKDETGRYVAYTAEELAALGYTLIIDSENPMVLTNEHIPQETEIKVTKEWLDGGNIGGHREAITVNLLADGEVIGSKELNKDNDWTYTWMNLPLKKAGRIINYTVQEIMSASLKEHYDSQVVRVTYPSDLVKGANLTEQAENMANAEGEASDDNIWEFKVTNTYRDEFVSKSVNKIWIDDDNRDKLRDENTVIQVQLYQEIDGTKTKYDDAATADADEGLVELTSANNWSYTWENLPKFAPGKEGVEIQYSIEEVTKLAGYEAFIKDTAAGFELTNFHDTDKTSYGVVKYWVDNNNENRPRTVTFQLYAEKYNEAAGKWDAKEPVGDPAEFNGTGDRWEHIWTNLDKNFGGREIRYSLEEIGVDENYTVTYDAGEFVTYATNTSTTTEFSKTDITGSMELEGAVLQVTSEDGKTVIEQWTSGKAPHVIKGKLKAGNTYLLKEVSSPAGYGIAEPVKFTVNTDGKIQKVVMIDEYTNISILKTDDEGKPLAGAKLAIMDREKKEIIEEWVSADKAHVIQGKLVVGEAYILTELEVPLGYYKAEDMAFTVPENGKIELTMVDKAEEAVGKITATKRVSQITDDFEIIPHIMAKDATFYMALFKDAEGKERYTEYDIKSVVVKKDMSVSDLVTWEKMPSGTYYVFETDSKGNAIPLATEITETDETGKKYTYSCVLAEGTESNMVQLAMQQEMLEGVVNLENAYTEFPDGFYNTGEITINKKVLKDGKAHTSNSVFHAGIFTKDEKGNYKLLEPVVTLVNNGSVTVEVPLGGKDFTEPITYYVMETDDAGIPIDKDVFAYEVSGEGSVLLSTEESEGSVTIVNELKDNSVEMDILKVDEAGKGLAGATFQLFYKEGNMTAGRWTSTTETRTITLIPGTYTLSEINAPTGYVKGADAAITVSEDGEIKVSGADISYSGGIAKYVNRKSATTTPTATKTTYTTTGGGSAITTSSTSKASNAKTGDETPIALYVLVLFGAVAAAGYAVSRKRRSR